MLYKDGFTTCAEDVIKNGDKTDKVVAQFKQTGDRFDNPPTDEKDAAAEKVADAFRNGTHNDE